MGYSNLSHLRQCFCTALVKINHLVTLQPNPSAMGEFIRDGWHVFKATRKGSWLGHLNSVCIYGKLVSLPNKFKYSKSMMTIPEIFVTLHHIKIKPLTMTNDIMLVNCSSHTIVQSAQNHQCKPSPLSVGMGSMNNATSNPSTNRWLWYQPHTLSPCVYLSDVTLGAATSHLKAMAAILLMTRLTILSGASCSPRSPKFTHHTPFCSPKNRSHGGYLFGIGP